MKNNFNKRWHAKLYIIWLKLKNKFKYGKMTYEKYGINHTLPANKFDVMELILTKKIEKSFAIAVDDEINKL